ncbi:hypothetical protein D3C79_687410 [compost metagenome]
MLRSPVDEGLASCITQGDTQRMLARRGTKHQAGIRALGQALLDIDPLFIDTQRNHLSALGLQCNTRGDVPGILHPHAVLRIEQQHAQQVERLLRAGHDHHLLGAAIDATRIEDVLGDRCAKRLQALQLAIAQNGLGRLEQVAVHQAPPDRLRERVISAVAGQEGCRSCGVPVGIGQPAKMIAAQRQH